MLRRLAEASVRLPKLTAPEARTEIQSMGAVTLGTATGNRYGAVLSFSGLLVLGLILALTLGHATIEAFEPNGVATASRTLNQFMAVVTTSIALIIPLTANLYTPKLVKLYVTHPLIVGGLTVFVLGHALAMAMHLFPHGHFANRLITYAILVAYFGVLAGILPYLYGISHFLRPSFFMPMLTRKGVHDLRALGRGHRAFRNTLNLVETIDVVANIALTGMARGDRQLVLLALQSLHTLLYEIIGSACEGSQTWRTAKPAFVPGLAEEGQRFLMRQQVWPEAYVLAQMLKVMEVATKRQHEIGAELAGRLVDTASLAQLFKRDVVVELHIMSFNTLLRDAVEEKDLRRFQNLSYHYRLLIEAFHEVPDRMHEAAQHLLHYGRMAARTGLYFGIETVIFDLGELILSLAPRNEERAVELVQAWAGPLWQEAIEQGSLMRKVGWRTLLRVYWEARALGLAQLADALYWRYLSDAAIHKEQLEMVLDENRELHFEFNDRLMRFAYISPAAEAEARAFLQAW